MAIIEYYGGRITHKYLMGKTKAELARMYLDLLDAHEAQELYSSAYLTMLELVAPKLGFKPFYINGNTQQVVWAKSQEQANKLLLGESVYAFVEKEIKQSEGL